MCVLIGMHIGNFFVLVGSLQRAVIVYDAQPVWRRDNMPFVRGVEFSFVEDKGLEMRCVCIVYI